MSVEIVNEGDKLETGYILPDAPTLGIKRSRRSNVNGIAFRTKESLDAAIQFLVAARRRLYGDP